VVGSACCAVLAMALATTPEETPVPSQGGAPVAATPAAAPAPGSEGDAALPYPSTRKMAALLAELSRAVDPETCAFVSDRRVPIFRARADAAAGKEREPQLRLRLAIEELQAGEVEAAIATVEKGLAAAAALDGKRPENELDELERTRILCWLRLGEVENCLAKHCCQSCIAPIDSKGMHSNRRGSEKAIEYLNVALEKRPSSEEYRWLLNLAHMTLGTWPDQVPEKYRIPRERFASDCELPRFKDVAVQCGLGLSTISGGVCLEDFDRDGCLDVMVSCIGFNDQMHFFRSNGDGTFADRTAEAGLTGLCGGLNMIHADYDNDGWTDVFVIRGAWLDEWGQIPDSLLRNRGDGTFEDVTEAAGLLSFHPSQAASFADFNGDGWLDLVIGNETQRESDKPHPAELFLSQRDGTFKEVAHAVGSDQVAFTKAVAVGDYDNDGRPDLFFSRRAKPNVLLRNVPDEKSGTGFRFVDVTRQTGITGPNMSFPSWFFDFDNDGWLDLYVASNSGFGGNISNDGIGAFVAGTATRHLLEMPALYHNQRNGRFKEEGRELGVARAILSMGSNYGDFDNDGWLDFYLGNGAPSLAALLPNKAFRNDGGKRFQDVTTAGGFGHLQKGHGVAFADLDNDGDQDVFCEVGGFYPADTYPNVLFENPGGSGNHWVTIEFQGVKANRSAIGARVRVDLRTPSGKRSLHLVVGTGGSFGANSLQQEIGLGDAEAIEHVFVRWPGSNTEQTVPGPAMDSFWRLREDATECEPVKREVFKLGG